MKTGRQQRILEIIEEKEIEKQEELASLLRQEGFDVTQATVSRDIRQLKLKKLPNENGKLVYVLRKTQEQMPEAKYIRILRESYVSMDMAMNILVIKTVSGMAMAAAAALDACRFNEIVGCIAGDDTIMCAVRSVPDTVHVKKKIENLLEEG